MGDAPERIWLQSDGGFYDKDKAVGSVTWCLYVINNTDTEYVRADLAPAAPQVSVMDDVAFGKAYLKGFADGKAVAQEEAALAALSELTKE